jgi:hypothetical protein
MNWVVKDLTDDEIGITCFSFKSIYSVYFPLEHVTLDGVEQVNQSVNIFVDLAPVGSYGRGRYEHHDMGPVFHFMRLPDKRSLGSSERNRRTISEMDISEWMNGKRIEQYAEIELVIKAVN